MFANVKTSVRRKLMVVVLATTAVALLTTGIALLVYDLRTFQRQWVNDLTTQADILGRSIAPALAFDDQRAARENLALLSYRPNIVAAAIYGADGAIYATYLLDEARPMAFPPKPDYDGHRIEGKHIAVARPVRDSDGVIGAVYIRARYELLDRVMHYGGILGGVMALSLLVAAFMSSRLEKAVTRPILAVTQVAQRVMTDRDFSLRVQRTTDDEIGYLVDAFNNMLAEVGERAAELEASNRRLEAEMAERRAAEDALREADRRKDEFLATLAHELRNPLAPMRNALELLRLAGDNPSVSKQARDIIHRQLAQMVHLVNDLLDVSRITTGKIALHPVEAELGTIVRESVVAAEHALQSRNHHFTLELANEPVRLVCDPVRLTQVFSNLINNAAKYTPPGGDIRLAVRPVDGTAEVTVTDNGQGIPAHMLDAIFDMFTQVDHSLERSQSGLGVGLSLARRLVALHGGTIEAHSDGPGRGSRFVVKLPLQHGRLQAGAAAGEVSAHDAAAAPLRILIADDNRDYADSLAILLRGAGHAVTVVHDGASAAAQAAVMRPHLAFLDIGLPGLNGHELARRLRSEPATRDATLVAITGWGQDKDKAVSRDAGFDRHLVKPVAPETVAAVATGVAARIAQSRRTLSDG